MLFMEMFTSKHLSKKYKPKETLEIFNLPTKKNHESHYRQQF